MPRKKQETKTLPLERWPTVTVKKVLPNVRTGYYRNPENELELLPDLEQVAIIEQSFDLLESGSSLREVSEWLSQKLKKHVSHVTLNKLYDNHRKAFLYGRAKARRKTIKWSKEAIEKRMATQKANTAIRKAQEAVEVKKEVEQKYFDKVKKKTDPVDFSPSEVKEFAKPDLDTIPAANIIFQPNPGPQSWFLAAEETEVLYGGSAGGEPKSWFSASFPSNRSKQTW